MRFSGPLTWRGLPLQKSAHMLLRPMVSRRTSDRPGAGTAPEGPDSSASENLRRRSTVATALSVRQLCSLMRPPCTQGPGTAFTLSRVYSEDQALRRAEAL